MWINIFLIVTFSNLVMRKMETKVPQMQGLAPSFASNSFCKLWLINMLALVAVENVSECACAELGARRRSTRWWITFPLVKASSRSKLKFSEIFFFFLFLGKKILGFALDSTCTLSVASAAADNNYGVTVVNCRHSCRRWREKWKTIQGVGVRGVKESERTLNGWSMGLIRTVLLSRVTCKLWIVPFQVSCSGYPLTLTGSFWGRSQETKAPGGFYNTSRSHRG